MQDLPYKQAACLQEDACIGYWVCAMKVLGRSNQDKWLDVLEVSLDSISLHAEGATPACRDTESHSVNEQQVLGATVRQIEDAFALLHSRALLTNSIIPA